MSIENKSPEENNKSPEEILRDLEKQKSFGRISDANSKLDTGKEGRKQLTKLHKDILKGSLNDQEPLKDALTPPTGTLSLEGERVAYSKEEYLLAESDFSQRFDNPLIKGCISLGEDCVALGKATGSVAKGIAYAPKDLYDVIVGNATYDGFNNV